MTRRSALEFAILGAGVVAATLAGVHAGRVYGPYGEVGEFDPRVSRVLDSVTGHLKVLIFDSDGDLKFDSWSYMAADGETLLRLETDDDGDGLVDRRKFFGPDGRLQRTEDLDRGGTVVRTEPAR